MRPHLATIGDNPLHELSTSPHQKLSLNQLAGRFLIVINLERARVKGVLAKKRLCRLQPKHSRVGIDIASLRNPDTTQQICEGNTALVVSKAPWRNGIRLGMPLSCQQSSHNDRCSDNYGSNPFPLHVLLDHESSNQVPRRHEEFLNHWDF